MKKSIFFTIVLCFITGLTYSQDWKSKLNQARLLYQKGDFEKSLNLYEEAKNLAPESIDFSSEIGQAAYKANNFPKAKSYYESAVLKAENNSSGTNQYHNLGNAQMKMKDYSSAINSYKEALRKNPNDAETRYNLSEAIRKNKNEKKNPESKNNPNKNNQPPNKPNEKPKKDNDQPADIPKRAVDRMLDKLSKKEAETKKKINNGTGKKSNQTNCEKDW
ncbi:MAG: tetratricopeptide repeat protein [Bacteroidota bacterium]